MICQKTRNDKSILKVLHILSAYRLHCSTVQTYALSVRPTSPWVNIGQQKPRTPQGEALQNDS